MSETERQDEQERGEETAPAEARASAGASAVALPYRRRKQAVVVVHGMGEQKPLETLRAFVEAVWGGKPTPREGPSDDDIWLVPDTRAGQTELARVTTRYNRDGVATDFYELYWSDLLVDNSLAQIRGWVTGLLLRWPHQVPRETAVFWVLLWAIVGVIAALAAYVGLTGSVKELLDLFREAEVLHNNVTLAASAVLTVVLWWLLGARLKSNLLSWRHNASRTFPGIWALATPAEASLAAGLSWAVVILLPPLVGLAAYLWFPWSVLAGHRTWALIAAAAIALALSAWVVPVFGDVARYVRTSPDAVSARAEIRERGVALLRALHGPKPTATLRYDHGDSSGYERIVVVGHSLGSIIAYDILRLFWQERGPSGANPVSADALRELRLLDAYCAGCSEKPESLDVVRLRHQQNAVHRALAAQPGGWLVSDFVTLGSPLTHAEFLVSRDRTAFEERKAERLFPTCPPMLEPGSDSFLFPERTKDHAHHAAMFAAMRWTNIHDPGAVPFFGDFISGPCRSNFGPGVLDLPVRIDRGGPLGRLVTHTDYWNTGATGKATDEVGAKLGLSKLSEEPQAHLALLRAALALR